MKRKKKNVEFEDIEIKEEYMDTIEKGCPCGKGCKPQKIRTVVEAQNQKRANLNGF